MENNNYIILNYELTKEDIQSPDNLNKFIERVNSSLKGLNVLRYHTFNKNHFILEGTKNDNKNKEYLIDCFRLCDAEKCLNKKIRENPDLTIFNSFIIINIDYYVICQENYIIYIFEKDKNIEKSKLDLNEDNIRIPTSKLKER